MPLKACKVILSRLEEVASPAMIDGAKLKGMAKGMALTGLSRERIEQL